MNLRWMPLFALLALPGLVAAQDQDPNGPTATAPSPPPVRRPAPLDPLTPPPSPRLQLDPNLGSVKPPPVPAPADPTIPPDTRDSIMAPPPPPEEPDEPADSEPVGSE